MCHTTPLLPICQRMRGTLLLISLLITVVCNTSAFEHTHVRRSNTVSMYVSHGPYVFEVGRPPSGVDKDLYYRIVQRTWDMVIERELGNSDVLYAIEHSDEFSDSVPPELLELVRPVVSRAVKEAKKMNSSRHKKRSGYNTSGGDSSQPFMDVHPTEDRYLRMVHGLESTINEAFEEEKINRTQYYTMMARVGELYRLSRNTSRELRDAISKCTNACTEIQQEILGLL